MLGRQPQAREAKTGGFPRFLGWLVYLVSSGSVKDLVYKNKVHGREYEARFPFGRHTHAHMYMTPPNKHTYTHIPPRGVGSEGNILVTIYTGQNSENSLSSSLDMQNNSGLLSAFLGL